MDHQVVTFVCAADLFAALGYGQRFDLILLALRDEATYKGLYAACEVLGMSMLVVPQGEPWKDLQLWNDELVRQKHAVPQRGDSPAWVVQSWEMVRGAYRFIDATGTVFLRDREIYLPPQSFAFAAALFQNTDTVLTREWLWNSIWRAPPQL